MTSISKGKTFEREIAKYLTSQTGARWMRVPQSGAMPVRNKKFKGDVYTEHEDFQDVIIECKHHKALELNEIFSKDSKVWKWIRKLEQHEKSIWVLFVKADRKGTYIITPHFFLMMRLHLARPIDLRINSRYIMIKLR